MLGPPCQHKTLGELSSLPSRQAGREGFEYERILYKIVYGLHEIVDYELKGASNYVNWAKEPNYEPLNCFHNICLIDAQQRSLKLFIS